ncbi:MAG: 23S rRNA (uracil(1939)-C(5))-methyltransferase RlmD [Bacilli bacterium]|nr:23S rRNA (uracil(1939)-C(5))-methyltransferase RlmD [Bacilli bacterium]
MEIKIKCDFLDHFGRGMGRYNNKIVFVSNLLPSEEAIIKITLDKKKYMEGEVISYLKKSSSRVCPKCSYSLCGCCLNNMNYEDSLEYKKNKVQNILKRFGGIDMLSLDIISSDNEYGYRNKITLKVKEGKLGYFKNGTNEIIEIDRCLITSDRINSIIKILKKEDLSKVSEIVIKDMDEVMIIIDGTMDYNNLKEVADSIYVNNKLVYGKENVLSTLGDYKFYVSPKSFFQVNKNVTLKMYNKIIEYAGIGDKVIDLYCGCGTISMFLSNNYNKVIGIEINKEAIDMALKNKKINNISNVDFKCGDANKLVKGLNCDTLVVDPARAGLKENGINNILSIKPGKIVYVSCNPVTLARDLKLLGSAYLVKDITLFDMFPWTYHVESVCLLERKVY